MILMIWGEKMKNCKSNVYFFIVCDTLPQIFINFSIKNIYFPNSENKTSQKMRSTHTFKTSGEKMVSKSGVEGGGKRVEQGWKKIIYLENIQPCRCILAWEPSFACKLNLLV